MSSTNVLLSIIIPIAGSLSILVWRRKQAHFALFTAAAAFLSVTWLIPPAMRGETFVSPYFMADGLSVFFAAISSLVGALIVLYSIGYMKKYRNLTEYYFCVTLFIGSMLGLVFSANLILVYVFWEMAAICSWRLIGFHRGEKDIWAANKAFLITFLGASVMLVGFVMVYLDAGTFNLAELRGSGITGLAFLLIFIGIMAKSCVFPLHTWLPDAGIAPSPVTALLHAAVLVKIGIYGYARFFCDVFRIPQEAGRYVAALAITSAVIAGCSALRERNIKRILAYSTISQLAFILFGLAVTGVIGMTGALLFIFAHALGKAGLFLCAGIIEQKTGTKDIKQMGGMMKVLPVTGVASALCALSVAGIPPLAGFWGKFLIIVGPIKEHQFIFAGLAVASCILTLLYLIRLFDTVFLGDVSHPGISERSSSLMLISVSVLALLSLLGGIFAGIPGEFVQVVRDQIMVLR